MSVGWLAGGRQSLALTEELSLNLLVLKMLEISPSRCSTGMIW